MGKVVIHRLNVQQGTSTQFQIKLPGGARGISGVKVTHSLESAALSTVYPIQSETETGWLYLHTQGINAPFFSSVLHPQTHAQFEGGFTGSISTGEKWYLSGNVHEFKAVRRQLTAPLVTGFYRDVTPEQSTQGAFYTLTIYLKLY